jgi:acyl carrier protein
MTITREQLEHLVYDCVHEINELLTGGVTLSRAPETVLVGEGGLDSLGIVNLVGLLEDEIESKLDRTVVLADTDVPFSTIGELVDVLHARINH